MGKINLQPNRMNAPSGLNTAMKYQQVQSIQLADDNTIQKGIQAFAGFMGNLAEKEEQASNNEMIRAIQLEKAKLDNEIVESEAIENQKLTSPLLADHMKIGTAESYSDRLNKMIDDKFKGKGYYDNEKMQSIVAGMKNQYRAEYISNHTRKRAKYIANSYVKGYQDKMKNIQVALNTGTVDSPKFEKEFADEMPNIKQMIELGIPPYAGMNMKQAKAQFYDDSLKNSHLTNIRNFQNEEDLNKYVKGMKSELNATEMKQFETAIKHQKGTLKVDKEDNISSIFLDMQAGKEFTRESLKQAGFSDKEIFPLMTYQERRQEKANREIQNTIRKEQIAKKNIEDRDFLFSNIALAKTSGQISEKQEQRLQEFKNASITKLNTELNKMINTNIKIKKIQSVEKQERLKTQYDEIMGKITNLSGNDLENLGILKKQLNDLKLEGLDIDYSQRLASLEESGKAKYITQLRRNIKTILKGSPNIPYEEDEIFDNSMIFKINSKENIDVLSGQIENVAMQLFEEGKVSTYEELEKAISIRLKELTNAEIEVETATMLQRFMQPSHFTDSQDFAGDEGKSIGAFKDVLSNQNSESTFKKISEQKKEKSFNEFGKMIINRVGKEAWDSLSEAEKKAEYQEFLNGNKK